MKFFSLLFFCFLVSCVEKKDCNLDYVDLNNNVYKIKGCIIDSLEVGNWYLYDTLNELSEWGFFEKGLKSGNWYYLKNNKDSVINWNIYKNNRLGIITNIPDFMYKEVDSSYFVKFKYLDTSRLLTLVITVDNPIFKSTNIENFYKIGEQEILERNYSYTANRNELNTKRGKYFSNWYSLSSNQREEFEILTFYGVLANKFIEITCTFDKQNQYLATTIFTSIVSNFFLGKNRFIYPFDKVDVKKF